MLGELTGEPSLYGGMSWHGAVDAPAFEAFRFGDWVRAYVQSAHDLPKGKYKLWMYGDKTTKDAPVEEAVAMAVRVLERQNAIVELVIAAVMDELHGRGPDSGMWWYNALAKPNVTQMLACRTFESNDDVLASLRLSGIMISEKFGGVDRYAANLWFDSEFEEEHDFCVLTDGDKVLGTGYLDSPMAYGFKFDEE
jgi:hypothetical protein